MEPFLALGNLLSSQDHDVICAFPEQFRPLAEKSHLKFASLGSKFLEMLDSEEGKIAMGGSNSSFRKLLAYIRLSRNQTEIQKELILKQRELIEQEKPDRILHNGKAIYPVIWGIQNHKRPILVSPVPYIHYVKDHTHIAFNCNLGPVINKLTYSLANFGLIKTVMISLKWLKITKDLRQKQVQNALLTGNAIYTISPSLFKRPSYWDAHIKVLGYQENLSNTSWQPPPELESFLKKHKKILFVTFGSMTNPNPENHTNTITEIVERNSIPAIINTAAGGLVKPELYNKDLLYFTSDIPYDWIFPKVYGVIHHGGSGTTHMALKYGCATLIIPHIIDQFVWNKIVSKLGAGPLGVKISKLTAEKIEPKIISLFNNELFKEKAKNLSQKMMIENFTEELLETITVEQ